MEKVEENHAPVLPKDVWLLIIQNLDLLDIIFLRASNSTFYKWSKESRPFPRFFVLDQDSLSEYLIKNGFISCLDYVRNALRFDWPSNACSLAARFGQVEVLKYLMTNGQTINKNTVLLECSQGTCNLPMITYLHEIGVSWKQDNITRSPSIHQLDDLYYDRDTSIQIVMENMAFHGHLSCMKYAMENGCNQRYLSYTPTIECLDFAIQNGFHWKEEPTIDQLIGTPTSDVVNSKRLRRMAAPKVSKRNICEEAARLGNLTILQYAHQKGAPLNKSARIAAHAGHMDCMIYALDNSPADVDLPLGAKTMECFKCLVDNYNLLTRHNAREMWEYQIKIGNVDILRFMLENEIPTPDLPNLQILLSLALLNFEVFKFFVDELKVPCTSINVYTRLAQDGNVEGLKFAFERNLPWNISTSQIFPTPPSSLIFEIIQGALKSKNLDVLKFVWEKLVPEKQADVGLCLTTAAEFSSPDILDFLTQKGAQWTHKHLTAASEFKNLPNMSYLTKVGGCQWTNAECIDHSSVCVKYARAHGCTNVTDGEPGSFLKRRHPNAK